VTEAKPPPGPLHAFGSLPWDAFAKLLALLTALVPLMGAVQRTIAFWASGRVPPSLGPSTSIANLAAAGAGTLVFFVVLSSLPLGVAWYRAARQELATDEPQDGRTDTSRRRIDWRLVARRIRERRLVLLSVLTLVVIPVGSVFLILIMPAWLSLLTVSIASGVIVAQYTINMTGKITIRRLLPAAIILAVASGTVWGLSPRSTLADTVQADFTDDGTLVDGRFSLVATDDDGLYLLRCDPKSRVLWVRKDGVVSLTYLVAATPDPVMGRTFALTDENGRPSWTPLWASAFAGAPWRLGYVQSCESGPG
jgi:hypothetical protein